MSLSKSFVRLDSEELVQLLITSIFAGFFLSFDDWGVESFDAVFGVQNFLIASFAVFIILTTVVLVQKYLGTFYGYLVSYRFSWLGIILGLLVTAFSNGILPFFIPGGTNFQLISQKRLGKYCPFYNNAELFVINACAVVLPLMISIPFSMAYIPTQLWYFKPFIMAGLLTGLYSLIPLPRLLTPKKWSSRGVAGLRPYKQLEGGTYGFDLFYTSRYVFNGFSYYLLAVLTIIFVALALTFNIFSLVLTLLIALFFGALYQLLSKTLFS